MYKEGVPGEKILEIDLKNDSIRKMFASKQQFIQYLKIEMTSVTIHEINTLGNATNVQTLEL